LAALLVFAEYLRQPGALHFPSASFRDYNLQYMDYTDGGCGFMVFQMPPEQA